MISNSAAAVNAWLRAGAEVNAGLLLFSQMSHNTRFPAFIRINPAKFRSYLLEKLCEMVGIESPQIDTARSNKFRDDYPFLRNDDCPQELKILASDKITAHERYVAAHDRLFDVIDLQDCYCTAREAIANFLENRAIYSELDHYREHHAVLGRHAIFAHTNELKRLRALKITSLITEQRRLKGAIWRAIDEIKKGNKPHLQAEREMRLSHKKAQLTEVEKFIEIYNAR